MNYHNLAKALRYSMDTVENLLSQLQANPLARFPQEDNNPTNDHTMQRLVTADALQDADREQEANLLRDLKQHVVVKDGRVRAGKLIEPENFDSPIHRARTHAVERLYNIIGDRPILGIGTIRQRIPIRLGNTDVQYVPIHEAKDRVADYLESLIPQHQHTNSFRQALHNLRNTPYEEVDENHPTEKIV